MCLETLPKGCHTDSTPCQLLHLPRTVVMIGMMGVGKTVIGKRLAAYLKVPFFDSDSVVETESGCTICDFFVHYGEKAFRKKEREILVAHLLSGPVCVLSGGAGAFMDPQTRAVIKAHAVSVWLKASLDLLVRRTTGRMQNPRPLLRHGNPRAVLYHLLKERSPVYATADIIINTEDDSCETIVKRVAASLTDHFDSVEAKSAP